MFRFLHRDSSVPLLLLAGSPLFAGLTPSELKTVENFTHVRRYLAGEVIFDEGEEGLALYIVLAGRVAICLPGRFAAPIIELGAGDFFGELALLDDAPRSAQARASDECELAVLFRGDFERLMDSHARIASRIALSLARDLGHRLRDTLGLQEGA